MVTSALPTLGIGASADGRSTVLPCPNAIGYLPQAPADDSLDTYVASEGLAGGH